MPQLIVPDLIFDLIFDLISENTLTTPSPKISGNIKKVFTKIAATPYDSRLFSIQKLH
jgi:hypothetical protein